LLEIIQWTNDSQCYVISPRSLVVKEGFTRVSKRTSFINGLAMLLVMCNVLKRVLMSLRFCLTVQWEGLMTDSTALII